jgi:hypothetical protein
MHLELPHNYNFFSNKNVDAIGGPFMISNIPSPPLFSPILSNTLNQNIDDDVVMNINDSSSTLNVHLPRVS